MLTAIFITILLVTSAFHLVRSEKVKIVQKVKTQDLLNWASVAIVLGLTIGSLSLTSFGSPKFEMIEWDDLAPFGQHLLFLLILIVCRLISIKRGIF